jgi:hypothetical protein
MILHPFYLKKIIRDTDGIKLIVIETLSIILTVISLIGSLSRWLKHACFNCFTETLSQA